MLFAVSERLKIFVSVLMACGPRCLSCKLEIPSGPVAEVFFVLRMACSVMVVVKGVGMFGSSVIEWTGLRMARSSYLCGSLQMLVCVEYVCLLFVCVCVRMASWVSVLSVSLLLRQILSFQSLEEFVLCAIPSSSCFHLVVCSCLIPSSISVFSAPFLSRMPGVGICLRSWARV